jgi:CubicO group peptidase (beta-lactamase class C family)
LLGNMNPSPVSRRQFLASTSVGFAGLALGGRARAAAAGGETALPKTRAVLLRGMERGLHIGAQVHVAREGRPAADLAVGEAKPGVAMTPDTVMTWYSMTKPLTSLCIAQCWDRGQLQLDDPVAKHVPEFAQHGKERITIRHVLTHTAGFPHADLDVRFKRPWPEIIATICAARIEDGWEVGRQALYHPSSGMYVLGEIVARLSGRSFSDYIRRELFEPLRMDDCWVGMPADKWRAYGDRMGTMMDTDAGAPVPASLYKDVGLEGWATICVPGGNGHGPMRQLARFYRMMLNGGALDGVRVVSEKAAREFTAVHRPDAPTFKGKGPMAPWGLGFSRQRAVGGPHCGEGTYGHGGSVSSVSFGDPQHRVAAAIVCNGRCKQPDHAARMREIAGAIYEDLGLAGKRG